MKKISNSEMLSMLGSLLLAIFISIAGILLSVKWGFATDSLIIESMDKVDYYQMVYDDFQDKCVSLTIPYGLQPEVFDGVFTPEQIRYDGMRYLKAELNSTVFDIDTDGYKQKLSDNIYEYIEENNLTSDGNVDEIVAEFTDDVMDYYIDIIRIPYAAKIGVLFRTIKNYFSSIFAIMMILIAVVTGIITKLNPHKKNRIFRYLAYSTMSGAFSILVVPAFCNINGFYRRLQIYPEYMYKFIVKYIESGLNKMFLIGGTLFVLSLIMIALSSYIKHRYKHPEKYHKKKTAKNK